MMRRVALARCDVAHGIAKESGMRYGDAMTKLLAEALAATDKLPPDVQDDLARMILSIVDRESDVYVLSADEIADLETALGEADRGEFATDEEVAALWTTHTL
jgi:hypothetical protein